MFVYRFLQNEYVWIQILSEIEGCILTELRVESIVTNIPYTSSMRFQVHIHVDVPDGTGVLYKSLDSNIALLILDPLRWDLHRVGCYDCAIVQTR